MEIKVEEIGPFRIYPPMPGKEGWSMGHDGGWLPVILANRDACLLVAGLVLAGVTYNQLTVLRDEYNHAEPPISVTCDHLITHESQLFGGPAT